MEAILNGISISEISSIQKTTSSIKYDWGHGDE